MDRGRFKGYHLASVVSGGDTTGFKTRTIILLKDDIAVGERIRLQGMQLARSRQRVFDYYHRVSSVLNRDVKLYGKKHIFDGNDETCWNSDQGSPQWIEIEFPDVKNLSAFEIQFQGGFVGKDCQIEIVPGPESEKYVEPFYPEDINSLQKFSLKRVTSAKVVKFVFNSSTDFFGRIVVYSLTLYGSS